MILDAFEETVDLIKNARNGIVKSSLVFKNQLTDKRLSLNSKMRLGMGTLTLATGPSGTGKTAIIDSEFVLNPILDHISWPDEFPPIYCVYRSLERPIVSKMGKFIAYLMYMATDGQNLVDTATLFGYPNKKRDLTDEDIYLIESLKDTIYQISGSLDLVGNTGTPEELKQYMLRALYRLGVYVTTDLDNIYINGKKIDKKFTETDEFGRPYAILRWPKTGKEQKVYPGFGKYYAHDSRMVIINVNDTVDRILMPPRYDANMTVDEHSNNQAEFRKHDAFCGIDIKQFSKESEKDFKAKGSMLSVSSSDVKGSSVLTQNIDIGMSILDPHHFGVTEYGAHPEGRHKGIDIDRFFGTFRIFQLYKNTDGQNLFKMCLLLIGEIGFFVEVPSPDKITEQDYKDLVSKYLQHLDPSVDKSPRQGFLLDMPEMRIKKPNRDPQAPF
jgi:hypothetical protein